MASSKIKQWVLTDIGLAGVVLLFFFLGKYYVDNEIASKVEKATLVAVENAKILSFLESDYFVRRNELKFRVHQLKTDAASYLSSNKIDDKIAGKLTYYAVLNEAVFSGFADELHPYVFTRPETDGVLFVDEDLANLPISSAIHVGYSPRTPMDKIIGHRNTLIPLVGGTFVEQMNDIRFRVIFVEAMRVALKEAKQRYSKNPVEAIDLTVIQQRAFSLSEIFGKQMFKGDKANAISALSNLYFGSLFVPGATP